MSEMSEMTYEETVELEANVKIKNEANEICRAFRENVRLDIKDYQGDGRFKIWSDSNNAVYVKICKDHFTFQCRFLHESYDVDVTPSSVFSGIKSNYRGIDHLRSHLRKASNK